ncbi:MAG TPA: PaaI family thioesterase [Acidimicrobiia bacterium]|nr:PaaI family thioesterase [Acidimicrobiia bacterium]
MADDHPFGGFSAEIIEKLREAHSTTPLHNLLGLQFAASPAKSGDGGVVVEMPVAPGAFNGSGNLHGGAIATLVDVASGFAAARAGTFKPGENTLVTADLHVRYLGRPKGTVVRALATVERAGRQLIVVACRVEDDLGNVIAVADFSAMIVPLRQPLVSEGEEAGDARVPDL